MSWTHGDTVAGLFLAYAIHRRKGALLAGFAVGTLTTAYRAAVLIREEAGR